MINNIKFRSGTLCLRTLKPVNKIKQFMVENFVCLNTHQPQILTSPTVQGWPLGHSVGRETNRTVF